MKNKYKTSMNNWNSESFNYLNLTITERRQIK